MKKKVVTQSAVHVGAQDAELKNSPIAWEADEDTEALREAIPDGAACFFNDQAYSNGTVVHTGDARLRCDHGLWIPAGPADVDNP
jgi:uncharacterized protein DUF1496